MANKKKMTGSNKADPHEGAKIGAAAVGGAIVGAAGAVLATKALSDPKTKKKIQGAWDQVKEGAMDAFENIQERAGEVRDQAKGKVLEGKVEAQKAIKSGQKKLKK